VPEKVPEENPLEKRLSARMSSFTFIVNFPRIFPCRIGLMLLPDLILCHCRIGFMSLPDWFYVIAGLDPAISPAKGIPASERGNDIVSYKSKLGLIFPVE